MKKLFLLFISVCIATHLYALDKNLYEMFKDNEKIKVFLKDVVNETDLPRVKRDAFRNTFNSVAEKREGIKFVCVNTEMDADVIVTCRIKDYVFKEKAAPSYFGIAALVADTTAPKSSGKLMVDYEITSPKSGMVLLSFKNFSTIERRPIDDMTGEMGYINAVSKNVNRFLFRAFYKQRDRKL